MGLCFGKTSHAAIAAEDHCNSEIKVPAAKQDRTFSAKTQDDVFDESSSATSQPCDESKLSSDESEEETVVIDRNKNPCSNIIVGSVEYLKQHDAMLYAAIVERDAQDEGVVSIPDEKVSETTTQNQPTLPGTAGYLQEHYPKLYEEIVERSHQDEKAAETATESQASVPGSAGYLRQHYPKLYEEIVERSHQDEKAAQNATDSQTSVPGSAGYLRQHYPELYEEIVERSHQDEKAAATATESQASVPVAVAPQRKPSTAAVTRSSRRPIPTPKPPKTPIHERASFVKGEFCCSPVAPNLSEVQECVWRDALTATFDIKNPKAPLRLAVAYQADGAVVCLGPIAKWPVGVYQSVMRKALNTGYIVVDAKSYVDCIRQK